MSEPQTLEERVARAEAAVAPLRRQLEETRSALALARLRLEGERRLLDAAKQRQAELREQFRSVYAAGRRSPPE